MTAQRDVKKLVRDRQAKTGESFSTARMHVMKERAALLAADLPNGPTRHDAIVLKVNDGSARLKILGGDGEVTLRSSDVHRLAPGHVVALTVEKRWPWLGDAYVSGKVENVRIDITALGLEPLPLKDGELWDIRQYIEPYRARDAYAALWRKNTATPRPSYEFDEIAWGVLPGVDADDNPTCKAAELRNIGRAAESRKLLMKTVARDLRVLDAHAGLGSLEFDTFPERALIHYEIGVRIGELSLPSAVDIFLPWVRLYNRPFLRCLHGYGLCLWRAGRFNEAQAVFERILSFNPNDNQGVRFCWFDVREGRTWETMMARESAQRTAIVH